MRRGGSGRGVLVLYRRNGGDMLFLHFVVREKKRNFVR